MLDKTLYLIQSSFNATPAITQKLEQIYTENDAVVLMGEAILQTNLAFFQSLKQIYVLDIEAENLAQNNLPNLHVISYAQFADLVLSFERSIRLK